MSKNVIDGCVRLSEIIENELKKCQNDPHYFYEFYMQKSGFNHDGKLKDQPDKNEFNKVYFTAVENNHYKE